MCGILGIADFRDEISPENFNHALLKLRHRGPDLQKQSSLPLHPKGTLFLGHARLSIIDLSHSASQPMSTDDGNVTITFNGEIYNFKSIRQELEGLGHHFTTQGDTEVILHAYQQWGIDCLHKFIGMFAFVLYDRSQQKLILVGDRAGVKPLYYHQAPSGRFSFASELKALLALPNTSKELDMDALGLYFRYLYIPAPYTIFKKFSKVKPGHYLVFDLTTKNLEEQCYWDPITYYNKPKSQLSYAEAEHHVHELLIDACNLRMVSDVPVGIFLSSGYDSVGITAILQKNSLQKLKTFSIGFEESAYDESKQAKKIADYLGTDHTEAICSHLDAIALIPGLAHSYDEPFGDSSAIPTTLVSQLARKQVTVALSADAGDEVFCGYGKYHNKLNQMRGLHALRSLLAPPQNLAFKLNPTLKNQPKQQFLQTIFSLKNSSEIARFRIESDHINPNRLFKTPLTRTLHTPFDEFSLLDSQNNIIDKMMAIDYKIYLPGDILTKVDRATMSVSLEGREPLLDHRLLEFAATLPTSYKYHNGKPKFIYKNIIHKYIPESLMTQQKKGFSIPLAGWLNQELKPMVDHYLGESTIRQQGLFHWNHINHLRQQLEKNPTPSTATPVWLLLSFGLWHETYFTNS